MIDRAENKSIPGPREDRFEVFDGYGGPAAPHVHRRRCKECGSVQPMNSDVEVHSKHCEHYDRNAS